MESVMKRKYSIQIILTHILFATLLFSCEDTLEWYVGFNKQPEFFDGKGYERSLNVIDILRPDSTGGAPASFIHVEKTGPSSSDTNHLNRDGSHRN